MIYFKKTFLPNNWNPILKSFSYFFFLYFLFTPFAQSQIHYLDTYVFGADPSNNFFNGEFQNFKMAVDFEGNLAISKTFTNEFRFDDFKLLKKDPFNFFPKSVVGRLNVDSDTFSQILALENNFTNQITALRFDLKGNLILSGIFSGSLQFLDTLIFSSFDTTLFEEFPDSYLVKLDLDNEVSYLHQTSNNTGFQSIAIGSQNQVLGIGNYYDSISIDGSVLIARDTGSRKGLQLFERQGGDIFYFAFTENGNVIESNSIGNENPDYEGEIIFIDSNYYISGSIYDTLTLSGVLCFNNFLSNFSFPNIQPISVLDQFETEDNQSFEYRGGTLSAFNGPFDSSSVFCTTNVLNPVGMNSGNFQVSLVKRKTFDFCYDEAKEYFGPSSQKSNQGLVGATEDLKNHYLVFNHDMVQIVDSTIYQSSYSLNRLSYDSLSIPYGIETNFGARFIKSQNGFIYLIDTFSRTINIMGDSITPILNPNQQSYNYYIAKFIDCNSFAVNDGFLISGDSIFAPYPNLIYSWFKDGGPLTGELSYKIPINGGGFYSYTVTDPDSTCQRSSQNIYVTDLEKEKMPIVFSVIPNPNNGSFQILFDSRLSQSLLYKIFNSNGLLVKEGEVVESGTEFNLDNISSGLYLIKLFNEEQSVTEKFLVR